MNINLNSNNSTRYEEKNIGQETISAVQISLNNQLFCTSSWDGDVRCYNVCRQGNNIGSSLISRIGLDSPATSCCWNGESTNIIAGSLNGKVYLWDVASNSTNPQQIAQHNAPIVCVSLNKVTNILAAGSLDGDIRLYDMRSPNSVMNLQSNGFLSCMSNGMDDRRLAVSNGHETFQYDLTNTSKPLDYSKDQEEYTVALAYSPTKYFVSAFKSGIVQVKFADPKYNAKQDLSPLRFRVGKIGNYQYAINGLAISRQEEGILTASSDGSLVLWDAYKRKKFSTFEPSSSNPNGITCCNYSDDGSFLVYATGYNWDFGAPCMVGKTYKMDMSTHLYIRPQAYI